MFQTENMKWLLGIVIGITLMSLLLVTGCTGSTSAPTTGPASTVTTTKTVTATPPAQAAEAKFKWKFASVYPEGSATGYPLEVWMNLVEYYSKGQIKFERFFGGALGGQTAGVEGLKANSIDFGWVWPWTDFNKKFAGLTVFGGPVSQEGMARLSMPFYNGILYRIQRDGWEEYGVKMTFMYTGIPYGIVTIDKPVRTPADLKGLKLRVWGSDPAIEAVKRMGAVPAKLAFEEQYSAMKTKTVDGNVLGIPAEIMSNNFFEVAKHFNNAIWTVDYAGMAMSKKSYDSLPAELKTAVDKASIETSMFIMGYWPGSEEGLIKELEKKGMTYTKLTPAEQKAFTDLIKAEDIWEQFVKPNMDAGLYNEWKSEITRLRNIYG
ncbi:MAG: TRAP transporter substrate-binding protein [Chloroflexi bacterium]|nr:TRAP transporter substrate-binding protein [Chloroflexota bacterium]